MLQSAGQLRMLQLKLLLQMRLSVLQAESHVQKQRENNRRPNRAQLLMALDG
jgi:hypothetical protein